MRPITFSLFLILSAHPLVAQTPADRLDAVADELEAIVVDLEASQALTAGLRVRLSDLESLSVEHQAALADQDRLLAEFRGSVAALEAHDRASLTVAQDLRGQLETERRLTGWLVPLAGAAVAVAVVEAAVLGWKR